MGVQEHVGTIGMPFRVTYVFDFLGAMEGFSLLWG